MEQDKELFASASALFFPPRSDTTSNFTFFYKVGNKLIIEQVCRDSLVFSHLLNYLDMFLL